MGLALMGALRAIELGNLMEPKGSRLLPQRSTTPLNVSVSTLDLFYFIAAEKEEKT